MENAKDHFYVHVSVSDGSGYDVGPFDVSGGFRLADGAIDWIYKQIGLIKSKFPEATLIKHCWNYKQKGAGIFGDSAIVEIKVEISGFTFEILPLKPPHFTNAVEELIEAKQTYKI